LNKIVRVAIVVAKDKQDAAKYTCHEHDVELVVVGAHIECHTDVVFYSCIGRAVEATKQEVPVSRHCTCAEERLPPPPVPIILDLTLGNYVLWCDLFLLPLERY
jgi:hypothetical protein